jgi:hypothetical protein
MPTGTVTNLLTGNQSDCGDTSNPELLTLNQQTGGDALGNTTGFSAWRTGSTIVYTTSKAHSGSGCIQVTTPGNVVSEGILGASTTVSASTAYIGGVWVLAPNGALMFAQLSDNIDKASNTYFTGTGAWQYIEIPDTTDTHTSLLLNVATKDSGSPQAITFYVDDCRLATNVTTGFTSSASATLSVSPYTPYQGLRSLKVVTPGTVVNEGLYFTQTGLTIGQTYTLQYQTIIPVGKTLHTGISGFYQNITATGSWQTINYTFTATATSHSLYLTTITSAQAITVYMDSLSLETGSTAHNWAYGTSSYDLGYSLQSGLLVEEATTNLLTANQSTGTDSGGNTTGFSVNNGATLSSSNTQAMQGSYSLKVVTPGAVAVEGTYLALSGLTNAVSYNISGWVYAPLGSIFSIYGAYYTGTGNWQYVTYSWTQSGTTLNIYITTSSYAQAITFYVDMLQLEQKAYPTSWTLGGTTRNAVTCTIPSSVVISDVSNYANYLTVNQSNIETNTVGLQTLGTGTVTLTRDTTTFYQGTASAKLVCDGTISGQGLSTEAQKVYSNGANQHWTVSGRVKGIAGTTVVIGLREFDSGSSFLRETDSTSFTLTGGWDLLNVTLTTGTNTLYVAMNIVTNSTENITFNVDALMMEARPHLDPWIVGGSQVSNEQGTIEFDLFVDTSSVAGNTTVEPISLYLVVMVQ